MSNSSDNYDLLSITRPTKSSLAKSVHYRGIRGTAPLSDRNRGGIISKNGSPISLSSKYAGNQNKISLQNGTFTGDTKTGHVKNGISKHPAVDHLQSTPSKGIIVQRVVAWQPFKTRDNFAEALTGKKYPEKTVKFSNKTATKSVPTMDACEVADATLSTQKLRERQKLNSVRTHPIKHLQKQQHPITPHNYATSSCSTTITTFELLVNYCHRICQKLVIVLKSLLQHQQQFPHSPQCENGDNCVHSEVEGKVDVSSASKSSSSSDESSNVKASSIFPPPQQSLSGESARSPSHNSPCPTASTIQWTLQQLQDLVDTELRTLELRKKVESFTPQTSTSVISTSTTTTPILVTSQTEEKSIAQLPQQLQTASTTTLSGVAAFEQILKQPHQLESDVEVTSSQTGELVSEAQSEAANLLQSEQQQSLSANQPKQQTTSNGDDNNVQFPQQADIVFLLKFCTFIDGYLPFDEQCNLSTDGDYSLLIIGYLSKMINQLESINTNCTGDYATLIPGDSITDLTTGRQNANSGLSNSLNGSTSPPQHHTKFQPAYFQTLQKVIEKLDFIISPSSPNLTFEDPSIITTCIGDGLTYFFADRKNTFQIQTQKPDGTLVSLEHSALSGEVRSPSNQLMCVLCVEQSHIPGSYSVSYTLPREGTYTLIVKLFGKHIQGSPFVLHSINTGGHSGKILGESHLDDGFDEKCSIHGSASIKSTRSKATTSRSYGSNNSKKSMLASINEDLILKVGERGRKRGQFTNPQGICCGSYGSVWVTDSNNQCVQRFNENGDCVLRFGKPGRAVGHLQRPVGITLNQEEDRVLIADYDNRMVNIFDTSGIYKTRFGGGKLLGPKGVILVNDKVIVVDNKGHQMIMFEPTGKMIKKVGTNARNHPWSFAGPHYIAHNAALGRLYVTDFHSHSVKVFTNEMGFLFQFGANGEGNGQFNAPTGVAVDTTGNVLVADWGNNRIQIFDNTGSFLGFVRCKDSLYGPQDLATDLNDRVFVADSGNHSYKIYQYLC